MGDLAPPATYGAFVIVTDLAWCSHDPDLPLYTAFPFWLYGDNRTYLANVLSSKSLDRAVWRIGVALGLQQTVDPVGYYDFLKGRDVVFMPEFGDPSEDTRNLQLPHRLPWIDRLRALLADAATEHRSRGRDTAGVFHLAATSRAASGPPRSMHARRLWHSLPPTGRAAASLTSAWTTQLRTTVRTSSTKFIIAKTWPVRSRPRSLRC